MARTDLAAGKSADYLALSGSITGRPDRLGISEDHFTRLCGIARATRQDWAAEGLIDRQASPYSLRQLQEVIAIKELREAIEAPKSVAVVWRQLRDKFPVVCRARTFELVVDLHLLRSSWVTADEVILDSVRVGHPVQLVDLALPLEEAAEGFRLSARPATGGSRS
jgi:hypothetical protein